MNQALMRQLGFGKEVDKVNSGICPFCSTEALYFRNEQSRIEFKISGMCQSCQDNTFEDDHEQAR